MPGLDDILRRLLRMEGAVCAGIVERDSARLLAAAGNGVLPGVPATAIAGAARAAADLDRADVDAAPGEHAPEVEDLMVTSAAYFHILRQVDVPGGEAVLVYVRLRRGHADPAICRRELGSAQLRAAVVRACGADRPARTPRPLPAGRLSSPPRPLRLAAAPVDPAPPTPAAAGHDPVGTPWPPADAAARWSSNGGAPDRSGPAAVSPLPIPRLPVDPDEALGPAMMSLGLLANGIHGGTGDGGDLAPDARRSAPAGAPVPVTPRTPSPPPLPTSSARSAESGRSLGSLAASVAMSPAHPSSAQPMPAVPVRRRAAVHPVVPTRLPWPPTPAPQPRAPADCLPAAAAPEERAQDRSAARDRRVPLPRRVRGAQLVGLPTSPEAAPDPDGDAGAPPSVLRQGWMYDTTTLRRLLDGLRRLG